MSNSAKKKKKFKKMVNNQGLPNQNFKNEPFETQEVYQNYYAIRDEKSGRFLDMMAKVNDAVALREFETIVNAKSSLIAKYAGDFTMWYIGKLAMRKKEFINEAKEIGKAVDYVEIRNEPAI